MWIALAFIIVGSTIISSTLIKKEIKKNPNKINNLKIITIAIVIPIITFTTLFAINHMTNKIIDNQGNERQNNKTSQGEKENVGKVDEGENINEFYEKAKQKAEQEKNEKILQEKKTDGDLVNGYIKHEGKQKILQIGKENHVINIDESGDLKSYAEEITAGCNNDEWCEKSRFFEFIKKIPYQTDPEGGWQYNMKPIEVLNYNKGDCDERSFTLTSLLLQKKYKAVIVYAKKHAFVCMHIENKRNIYPNHAKLRINGLDYYYAETTDQNAYIGTFNKITPENFIGVYDANQKRLIPKKEIEFYHG